MDSMEAFNIKKMNNVEVKEQYRVKTSNRTGISKILDNIYIIVLEKILQKITELQSKMV
jgi:hypothetical protein